jgi:hypothetical protein
VLGWLVHTTVVRGKMPEAPKVKKKK